MYSKFNTPNLLDAVAGRDSLMITFLLTRDHRPIHTALICPPLATKDIKVGIDFSFGSVVELPPPFPILIVNVDGRLGQSNARKKFKVIPLDPFGRKAQKKQLETSQSLTDPLKININQSEFGFYIFILFSELVKDKWQIGRMVQTKDFNPKQPHPLANVIYQTLKS